jgi:hypothetical protein
VSLIGFLRGWLDPLAVGRGSQLAAGRQRAQAILDGLGQAEQVLTAAVDQELVGRGVFEATLKETTCWMPCARSDTARPTGSTPRPIRHSWPRNHGFSNRMSPPT